MLEEELFIGKKFRSLCCEPRLTKIINYVKKIKEMLLEQEIDITMELVGRRKRRKNKIKVCYYTSGR